MQKKSHRLLSVIALSLLFLFSEDGLTSGATQVTKKGKYYSVTLEMPRINFVPDYRRDPETGETHEQEFHREAEQHLAKVLEAYADGIERNVETLCREFGDRVGFVTFNYWLWPITRPHLESYDFTFPTFGYIELAFARAPEKELENEIAKRVQTLFSEKTMARPANVDVERRLIE